MPNKVTGRPVHVHMLIFPYILNKYLGYGWFSIWYLLCTRMLKHGI